MAFKFNPLYEPKFKLALWFKIKFKLKILISADRKFRSKNFN